MGLFCSLRQNTDLTLGNLFYLEILHQKEQKAAESRASNQAHTSALAEKGTEMTHNQNELSLILCTIISYCNGPLRQHPQKPLQQLQFS